MQPLVKSDDQNITVEREYGCGGGEIAQLLAERLGWELWGTNKLR